MFLNSLQEGNKELFLRLCVHASLSNEIFAEEEKEMIYAYCREMNIMERIPDGTDDLEQVVNYLATQTDDAEKKIIILEILGLIRADGIYDEKEKSFMKKLADGMKVQTDVLSKLNTLLENYLAVVEKIHKVIYE